MEDERDQHIDGNGVAGLLSEIGVSDVTSVMRTCHSCGARNALGAHMAYRGPGVVLRCPECSDIAVRVGVTETRLVAEWRGAFEWPRAASASP